MEPKRKRRPNVRLEELGDFPAAVACVVSSPRSNYSPARKRWRRASEDNPPEPADSALPPSVLQNGLPHLKSNGADTTKPLELDFGVITRKNRLANRRGRTAMGNNRVFAGAWGFSFSPGISDKAGKEDESIGYASDSPSVNPFGETEHVHNSRARVNRVGRWLEDIGFGRYAGLFGMHGVDEEALPLLTIQDLKEMGFSAVGTRRKLYQAIRQVAGDRSPRLHVPT